jgi:hypothetical protein
MNAPELQILPLTKGLFYIETEAELDATQIRAIEQAITKTEGHPHVLIHELFLANRVRTFFERDWHAPVSPKGANP